MPAIESNAPLAERMRPQQLSEVVGQSQILGKGGYLHGAGVGRQLTPLVFWGPPGTGKTTLARLLAEESDYCFEPLSAVLGGVRDIRDVVERAKARLDGINGDNVAASRTLLFVDEVHRFNKGQQDALLPHIEDGTLMFIGATTENPSYALNNAVLSRVRVLNLKPLATDDIVTLLNRALTDNKRGFGSRGLDVNESVIDVLAASADGDGRQALNMLEQIVLSLDESVTSVTIDQAQAVLTTNPRRFDKQGDYFYDQISAFHKSVRGSDPDAALYWMARMLDGGVDPLYIARRLVRIASEDVGNTDPRGLPLAVSAWEAYQRLGSPEGDLAIAHACVYLACAPKSNAIETAWHAAQAKVREQGTLEVPLHLRNATNAMAKAAGHKEGYRYDHDEPGAHAAGQTFLPAELIGERFYEPVERGYESRIAEKLRMLRQRNAEAGST